MSKCAREDCGKTVYPLEELKCLDKVWHKPCFKCSSCGMVLSMKTYKGYEKRPYCDAHYPKIAPTAVTNTPFQDTVKGNTMFQSQVKYHEAYEKSKGQKIEVANDPEMERLMKNSKNQSQAEYHKEQDKKKQQDSNRPQTDFASVPAGDQPKIGSIADYDPMSKATEKQPAEKAIAAQTQKSSSTKAQSQSQTPQANTPQQAKTGAGKTDTGGFVVRALYDYTAADKDEVSFQENDVILNCAMVDEGWMTGTVKRTMMWGMLPANYVEKVTQPTGMYKIK